MTLPELNKQLYMSSLLVATKTPEMLFVLERSSLFNIWIWLYSPQDLLEYMTSGREIGDWSQSWKGVFKTF